MSPKSVYEKGGDLVTAAQELACIVIAQAVVARVRAEAGGAAVLRVILRKWWP